MSFLSKLDLKFDPCFFGNVYGTKDHNQKHKKKNKKHEHSQIRVIAKDETPKRRLKIATVKTPSSIKLTLPSFPQKRGSLCSLQKSGTDVAFFFRRIPTNRKHDEIILSVLYDLLLRFGFPSPYCHHQ